MHPLHAFPEYECRGTDLLASNAAEQVCNFILILFNVNRNIYLRVTHQRKKRKNRKRFNKNDSRKRGCCAGAKRREWKRRANIFCLGQWRRTSVDTAPRRSSYQRFNAVWRAHCGASPASPIEPPITDNCTKVRLLAEVPEENLCPYAHHHPTGQGGVFRQMHWICPMFLVTTSTFPG